LRHLSKRVCNVCGYSLTTSPICWAAVLRIITDVLAKKWSIFVKNEIKTKNGRN
jgi:hypothetical protein